MTDPPIFIPVTPGHPGIRSLSNSTKATILGEMIGCGIVEQTEQVMTKIIAALDSADCGLEHVVKVNVWLDDPHYFTRFNTVLERYFADHSPARSTVQSRLMINGRVEMEVIAFKPEYSDNHEMKTPFVSLLR